MVILQVFAERLGLETGWNCHISLGSYANDLHANDENLTSSYVSETEELLNSSKSNIAQGSDIFVLVLYLFILCNAKHRLLAEC